VGTENVHNRVQSIRHCIQELVDGEEVIPLYHIDGEINLADLLMKPRPIDLKDVDAESTWMSGLPWMKLPTSELPKNEGCHVLRAEDKDLIDQELFLDVCTHLATVEAREMLVPIPLRGPSDYKQRLFFQ
jgi:hypothetical protein